MLIDEVISIDIDLASLSQSPLVHRTFACFLKLTTESKLEITPSNLQEQLLKIDAADREAVEMWFKSGGVSLSVYSNDTVFLATLTDIAEHNLVFAHNSVANQLAIYNALLTSAPVEGTRVSTVDKMVDKKLSTEKSTKSTHLSTSKSTTKSAATLLNKHLYFTVDDTYTATNYPAGRGIFCIYNNSVNKDKSIELFEYLAPYTKVDTYRKNSFESSSIQGLPLTTLNFITSNNMGALVYFSELKANQYYNMVDIVGFGLNRDFLVLDIEYKIKNRCLTALANGNKYTDGTLAKLDTVIASSVQYYVDTGYVLKYSTTYLPLVKQQPEDVINGIAKGFVVKYTPVDEVKKMSITLIEE